MDGVLDGVSEIEDSLFDGGHIVAEAAEAGVAAVAKYSAYPFSGVTVVDVRSFSRGYFVSIRKPYGGATNFTRMVLSGEDRFYFFKGESVGSLNPGFSCNKAELGRILDAVATADAATGVKVSLSILCFPFLVSERDARLTAPRQTVLALCVPVETGVRFSYPACSAQSALGSNQWQSRNAGMSFSPFRTTALSFCRSCDRVVSGPLSVCGGGAFSTPARTGCGNVGGSKFAQLLEGTAHAASNVAH